MFNSRAILRSTHLPKVKHTTAACSKLITQAYKYIVAEEKTVGTFGNKYVERKHCTCRQSDDTYSVYVERKHCT